MNKYVVAKRTGTHADVLAAIGAADVMGSFEPHIRDCGDRFEVSTRRDVTSKDLADVDPGFRYLKKTNASAPDLPLERIFDLAAQNQKEKRRRESAKSKDRVVQEFQQEDAPDPEYRMYVILSRLDAAAGPNGIVDEFAGRSQIEWTERIWNGFNGDAGFVSKPTLVQLFSPHAAKGYSLLKPNGTDRNDKSKDRWAEPFSEWLRYRGYFRGCSGWFCGKDIRLFCPIPGNISYTMYNNVAAALRSLPLGGSAPKVDCRATLGLARLLIERSGIYARPHRWIGGLWIAHYQDMGQSKTLMAIDQLAVPDWFDLSTKEDATLWLDTLSEHDKVLRRLNDSFSEELGLLKRYRKFLQQQGDQALDELLDFLARYGLLVLKMRSQNKWLLPQFTVEHVERILMDKPTYSEILQNPGLRSIADALRSATVSAQVAKRNNAPDYREIRYGALPEIRRKLSLGKDELLQAISEFVAEFNAESARRYELGKKGFRVSDNDLTAFVDLMDSAPSAALVGSMLCALATCRRGRIESSPETESEVESEQETVE